MEKGMIRRRRSRSFLSTTLRAKQPPPILIIPPAEGKRDAPSGSLSRSSKEERENEAAHFILPATRVGL